MTVRPSQLKSPRIVKHSVDVREDVPVEFVYDANKLRDAWIQEWAAIEAGEDSGKLSDMLADLIVGWDIVNDDGSMYPVTSNTIGEFFTIPDKILILRELMTAMNPSEEEKKGSSEPSAGPFLDGSSPPQNGSETLPSPTVSESVPAS